MRSLQDEIELARQIEDDLNRAVQRDQLKNAVLVALTVLAIVLWLWR